MPQALARSAIACLAALCCGAALAISYTVQVIAVSDQDSALSISRELLRDGYPAYVVRSTGAQGDVFRVRVGAFANRAAALRYADAMPEVAGSRPVPALAEAIPQGIMPLAPRLLVQEPWTTQEVRVSPWPGAGIAVRLQALDPLRQALYVVVQDGVERRFEAWLAVPLAVLPEPPQPAELDVPIVDLTVPPDVPADARPDEPDEPVQDDDTADPAEPAPTEAVPDEASADTPEAAPEADGVEADRVEAEGLAAWVADPASAEPEAGLLLVRDRWLWPPSWQADEDAVRTAFRSSLVAITARELALDEASVEALSYLPGGESPPALIVLDLSDRSARDAGHVLALGDTTASFRTHGPTRFVVGAAAPDVPAWPETRVRRDATPEAPLGGDGWTVRPDGPFVRITLADGATWRAGVGTPLWSDGRYVVAWDGATLLLYDFVAR